MRTKEGESCRARSSSAKESGSPWPEISVIGLGSGKPSPTERGRWFSAIEGNDSGVI